MGSRSNHSAGSWSQQPGESEADWENRVNKEISRRNAGGESKVRTSSDKKKKPKKKKQRRYLNTPASRKQQIKDLTGFE